MKERAVSGKKKTVFLHCLHQMNRGELKPNSQLNAINQEVLF